MSYEVNEKLVWNGSDAMKDFDAANFKALTESAIIVQDSTVKNLDHQVYSTPESPYYKRSGDLKASIDRKIEGIRAFVGTILKYAPWVEFGTRFVGARPYLRPGLLLNIEKIKARFKKAYKGVKYVK